MNKIKEGYLSWLGIIQHMAKGKRYTIGTRIENKFLDLLELSYKAYCSGKNKKAEHVEQCVLTLDTLKFLIYIAWEGRLISNKHFAEIAEKMDEIGKMLGGWKRSLKNPKKKNRTL